MGSLSACDNKFGRGVKVPRRPDSTKYAVNAVQLRRELTSGHAGQPVSHSSGGEKTMEVLHRGQKGGACLLEVKGFQHSSKGKHGTTGSGVR